MTFQEATEDDLIRLIAWLDRNGISDHALGDLWEWATGERVNNAQPYFEDMNDMLTHFANVP